MNFNAPNGRGARLTQFLANNPSFMRGHHIADRGAAARPSLAFNALQHDVTAGGMSGVTSQASVETAEGEEERRRENEHEDRKRRVCEQALQVMRQLPYYNDPDKVFGTVLYYDRQGDARYSPIRQIAQRRNHSVSDDNVTMNPNYAACEGRGLDPKAFRACLRRPRAIWEARPGYIWSHQGSNVLLHRNGGKPFTLLMSAPIDDVEGWANFYSIPRSKVLVNSCEGL